MSGWVPHSEDQAWLGLVLLLGWGWLLIDCETTRETGNAERGETQMRASWKGWAVVSSMVGKVPSEV